MTRQQFIKQVEGSQREVRRFLTALCHGDSAQADDLAQDTFMKAYLSCNGFREDSKFSTWIYRIAYNVFITHVRSARPGESLAKAEAMSDEMTADGQFEYQALYQSLEQLSVKERSAILLFYMQGYAVKEVAEIMSVSSDAVKQLLSRGRQHLKCLLNE